VKFLIVSVGRLRLRCRLDNCRSVGLSSGVSEIGVAGVGSMVFCITVLGLRIYGVLTPTSS
jgi:hypothetical protein